jgi:RHS repeat-associated protein
LRQRVARFSDGPHLTYGPSGAPDPSLTTTFSYDTTSASGTYPIGRLSSISKGVGTTAATVVNYTYDFFGRRLLDGVQGSSLSYAYDSNGNRTEITYSGNPPVTACYTYDVADRQSSLAFSTSTGQNVCQGTTTSVVTQASGPTVYASGGPLETLHLNNGITESHSFDQRFYPMAITVGTSGNPNLLPNWNYTTDAVGNIKAIGSQVYGYQDDQYFLTSATGPWGSRVWTYDSIGDRLREDRGSGNVDNYSYPPNAWTPAGNIPLLNSVALASGGTKSLTYDAGGNVVLEAAPTQHLDFTIDGSGKVARMGEETQHAGNVMTYDGRGYLASVLTNPTDCGPSSDCGPIRTVPTYSSDGVMYYRQQQALFSGSLLAQTSIFYFAGRPVAQIDGPPANGTLTYLSVDHLGTPLLASTTANPPTVPWSGGFEPFGRDYTGAMSQKIFLRFPGQWDDASWESSLASGLYYNLNRWYEPGTGRFSSPDALPSASSQYAYGTDNPVTLIDPLGLDSTAPTGNATTDACCETARKGDFFANTDAEGGASGIVVCCNGSKAPCVLVHDTSRLTPSGAKAYALIVKCEQDHEERHVPDLPNCPGCGLGPVPVSMARFNSAGDRKASECPSYAAEIACLVTAKGECGGDAICKNAITVVMGQRVTERQSHGCGALR